MSQTFTFGKPQVHQEPALVYVNKEPLSQTMYHRLCTNPDQAIMLYDKHNDINKNIPSIYNGYDLKTFGITTMFNNSPSLSECQNIWNKQLEQLKIQCIKHSSIVIVESDPNSTEANIKHSLGKLLSIDYRIDLQQKLDQFASEVHQSTTNTESEKNTIETKSEKVRNTNIDIESDHKQNASTSASNSASNDELTETQVSDAEDAGNTLLVFRNFEFYAMESMRQFVQIGQCIETLCLGIVTTKYLFLSYIDKCVLILFESEADTQMVMNKYNGMRIDAVTQSLEIQYASDTLTNRIKGMFTAIENKQMEQRKQWQQQREKEEKEHKQPTEHKPFRFGNKHQNDTNETKETNDIKTRTWSIKDIETIVSEQKQKQKQKQETQTETETIVSEQKQKQKQEKQETETETIASEPIVSEPKQKQEKFIFGQKAEVKSVKKWKKRKLKTSLTLKKGLMNIVETASQIVADNDIDDEMVFNIDKDKILSVFGEDLMARYIKQMYVSQKINVWQFKDHKKSQWIDVDMMLSMYLNILPLNESVVIKTSKSQLQFDLMRTSECSGVLMYRLLNVTSKCIEYKLNRITKSMQSGVYIPSFWEKQLLNRSLNKTYLYSIDLDVFDCFGELKHGIWYKYLKQYVSQAKLHSMASIQNWINYHSFYFYSNWKIATQNGVKMVRLWYIESYNEGMSALKNGFYCDDKHVHGWQFYANLEDAIKANRDNSNILLCQVCIDEKHETELLQSNGNASCTLTKSLCAYPELCIRLI